MELLITTQGMVTAIYSEVIPMQVLGQVQIRRASHVEPDSSGEWWADLSPSQGPLLGPFPSRSAALHAEYEWLSERVPLGPELFWKARQAQDEHTAASEVFAISERPANNPSKAFARCPHLPPQPIGDPS